MLEINVKQNSRWKSPKTTGIIYVRSKHPPAPKCGKTESDSSLVLKLKVLLESVWRDDVWIVFEYERQKTGVVIYFGNLTLENVPHEDRYLIKVL